MFNVGDEVVCVDAKQKKGAIAAITPINHLLEEGHIYRIESIHFPAYIQDMKTGEKWPSPKLIMSLKLEGISLPPPMLGFSAYRFKKIEKIEKKASINKRAQKHSRSKQVVPA